MLSWQLSDIAVYAGHNAVEVHSLGCAANVGSAG